MEETIQWRKLFKGGNYMRKYGTQIFRESTQILSGLFKFFPTSWSMVFDIVPCFFHKPKTSQLEALLYVQEAELLLGYTSVSAWQAH